MSEKAGVESLHKFDIIGFAKNIMNEINKVRAFENVLDDKIKVGHRKPIESRVNALFRLIGLPMFVTKEPIIKGGKQGSKEDSNGVTVMTPGYDKFEAADTDFIIFKNAEKLPQSSLKIADNLRFRENELGTIEESIGTEEMNTRMHKALHMSLPIQSNFPKDTPQNAKNIKVDTVGTGDNKRKVFKNLKPLITSYIEVFPKSHELAKPFLPELKRQKIDHQTVLAKPLIETIIRIRFAIGAQKTSDNNKTSDFLTSIKKTLGDKLYLEVFKDDVPEIFLQPNILEKFIIHKILSSTNKIAVKIVNLEHRRQILMMKHSFEISIKTTSSKANPFGKRAGITTDVNIKDKSTDGKKIKRLQVAIAKDEALLGLMPTDDTTNIAGDTPGQKTTKNVASTALSSSFISLINQDLNENKKKLRSLEEMTKKASSMIEKMRLESEMMTGEFSGISVPDVVAIIIGLFLISKADLLALVDDKVRENMKLDKTLESAIESLGPFSIEATEAAVFSLQDSVDSVFELIKNQTNAVRNRLQRTPNLSDRSKKTKRTETRVTVEDKMNNSDD